MSGVFDMAKPNGSQLVFRILLKAQPGKVPATVRLKRFLKLAFRAFGRKCVSCEEVQEDRKGEPGPQESQAEANPP